MSLPCSFVTTRQFRIRISLVFRTEFSDGVRRVQPRTEVGRWPLKAVSHARVLTSEISHGYCEARLNASIHTWGVFFFLTACETRSKKKS